MKRLLVTAYLLAALALHAGDLQEWDIIFQTSQSSQSLAIQRATHSPYSHMGVVVEHKGRLYVLEAGAKVKITPPEDWIRRGKDGRYAVKRLRNADEKLNSQTRSKLRVEALKLLGRPYDLYFEWSDERIYCSELVWKVFERAGIRLGEPQSLKDFDLTDNAVKIKLQERYRDNVPLNETVISPATIFDCPELLPVD